MGSHVSRGDVPQATLRELAWLDISLCILILFLLAITIRCLIRVMKRSSSLSSISLGYCVVVILIVIHDLGFNCLMLKYSEIPVKLRVWNHFYHKKTDFIISIMLNALKFYERFVLIVLHALLSINRACAVFTPLKYSYIFNLRNTSLMVASAFIICLPVFIIYAFQIFGCLYFFDPYEYTFYYNYNLCFHVHRIVEWFFAGFIMGTSTVADVLIAISLLRQRKKSGMDAFKDIRDFSFMLQTLVLSFTNGVSTLYLYTIGANSNEIPWIDHIPKLCDLLLALIYILAIALINNVVRAELMEFIRCRNNKVKVVQSMPAVTKVTTKKTIAQTS